MPNRTVDVDLAACNVHKPAFSIVALHAIGFDVGFKQHRKTTPKLKAECNSYCSTWMPLRNTTNSSYTNDSLFQLVAPLPGVDNPCRWKSPKTNLTWPQQPHPNVCKRQTQPSTSSDLEMNRLSSMCRTYQQHLGAVTVWQEEVEKTRIAACRFDFQKWTLRHRLCYFQHQRRVVI